MKPPDIYRDWRILFGVALIVLGVGNWIVGWQRTQEYETIIAAQARPPTAASEAVNRAFDELNAADADAAVLEPFNRAQSRVSYASARMDFYHATFLTGRVLVIIGVALTLLGFIGLIRNDALQAYERARHASP